MALRNRHPFINNDFMYSHRDKWGCKIFSLSLGGGTLQKMLRSTVLGCPMNVQRP